VSNFFSEILYLAEINGLFVDNIFYRSHSL